MSEINGIDLGYILRPENQLETIALARALCPFADHCTDATILICVAMVEAGGDIELVSSYLGFSLEVTRKHYQSHQSSRIMRELAKHKLTGEGYVKAISSLLDVAGSQSQTGTARNNASKTILELCENDIADSPSHANNGKDLNEMTLSELEDMVNSIKGDLKTLAPTPSPLAVGDSA